jgi:hypothetical protein
MQSNPLMRYAVALTLACVGIALAAQAGAQWFGGRGGGGGGGFSGGGRSFSRSGAASSGSLGANRSLNPGNYSRGGSASNGLTYYQCGSTWYQPSYQSGSVTYIVVTAPK